MALKCLGLVLVFDAGSLSAFELPKSVFSRGTEWLLVAAIGLSLVRFGPRIVPRTNLHLAVGLFVGANIVSAAFAADTFTALFGDSERYLGLAFVRDMGVLYLAVAIAYRNPRDWAVLAAIGAAGAALVIAYVTAQLVGLDPIHWVDNPIDRPFATLGHPDMLGHFLSVAFGISLGVSAFGVARSGGALRLFALGLAIAFAVAAGIVATRSSLLGFAAAAVVGGAVYLRDIPSRRLGRRLVLGSLVVAIVTAVLALSPVGERATATVIRGAEIEPRLAIYRAAVAAFERRPILGYGPDSFAVAYPQNRDERDALTLSRAPQSSAHSWILQSLVTTGLVGLATLVAVIAIGVWLLWTAGMARQPSLAGPLLMGLAAYWADGLVAVGTVGVDWFPWVAFGAAASISGMRDDVTRAVRRIPRFAEIAVGIAAGIAALSGLSALSAGEEAWQARVLWLRQSTASIGHATQAVTLDPGRAEYWNWLGRTRELANDWRAASDAYTKAAQRKPYDATYWDDLARSLARQALERDPSSGGGPAAIAAAERGVREDPNNPDANAVLADMASQFGQGDLALSAVVKAVQLYPLDGAYDTLVLRSARRASDLRSAAALLDRAIRAKDSALIRVAAGEIALRLGDAATARIHAARASQLEPNNADVRNLLRQVGGT